MNRTPLNRRRQTPHRGPRKRSRQRTRRPQKEHRAPFEKLLLLEDLARVEAHAEPCPRTPADPIERQFYVFSGLLKLNGAPKHQALKELLEVRKAVGASLKRARVEEIIELSYSHSEMRCG